MDPLKWTLDTTPPFLGSKVTAPSDCRRGRPGPGNETVFRMRGKRDTHMESIAPIGTGSKEGRAYPLPRFPTRHRRVFTRAPTKCCGSSKSYTRRAQDPKEVIYHTKLPPSTNLPRALRSQASRLSGERLYIFLQSPVTQTRSR